MNRLISGLGLILLSGCGSSTWYSEASLVVGDFQCGYSDVAQIRESIGNRVLSDIRTSDREAYTLVKELNSKMAKTCDIEVLKACAPGFEKDLSRNSIVGPVNALGITASSTLKEYYPHDGLARSVDYKLVTVTAVDSAKLQKGIACFLTELK